VVIIGGGPIGIELAESYRNLGLEVTILEVAPQILGMFDEEIAAKAVRHLRENGVSVRVRESVKEIVRIEQGFELRLENGTLTTGMVFVVAGVRPQTALARAAGLSLTPQGSITVDRFMATSDKVIYAVGDAVAVKELVSGDRMMVALAGPANRQARIAADNMAGGKQAYPGALTTAAVKVFDLTLASTGLNERQAAKLGLQCKSATIHNQNHAGHYPGAQPLTLKLLFQEDGRILGAQAIGYDGADKRIDVIATAMKGSLKVNDLAELDLAYAPPYSSAKDPVNMVAFEAQNILAGTLKPVYCRDLPGLHAKEWEIIDVRTPDERLTGTIPGDMAIGLDELRSCLHTFSKKKKYLLYCVSGQRSYMGARTLLQHGIDAHSLIGGYHTYSDLFGRSEAQDQSADATIPTAHTDSPDHSEVEMKVDATGLMCPGPLGLAAKQLKLLQRGQIMEITASDPAFESDITAWCASTGNDILSVAKDGTTITARIRKGLSDHLRHFESADGNDKTIVVFSDDIDKVIAAFFIANGAAAMGRHVTLFFTFWGLNVIRKPGSVPLKKDLISKVFGMMMPKGSRHLHLSQMNMGGAGTMLIRWLMLKKHIGTLEELIKKAQEAGVRLVACSTSMDIMGIQRDELIDGVTVGGVATYLDKA
ncbi:DsrE/DsrF/DrsH-like family protein, partial [Patescibacteria group bacterium]|nr:DsrE/DsrF/DrsH-like family protein [Patescibacteria group bacterium]